MRRLSVLLLGLLFTACEEKKPLPPPEPAPTSASPSGMAAALGLDAATLGDPTDPPAPPGDLRAELDRFVNVEQCVAERSKVDPLVGDARRAIGDDTFFRDACRLLEAAKDKKRETCERIDSSALRSRCKQWVAMIAQTPDACPMQFDALLTRGRHPSCVAIAAKDPRLCTGESRVIQRATCEALTTREEAKCDALLPQDRPTCKRELQRWRTVLAAPLEGLPKLPASRGKLVLKGDGNTPDPPNGEIDLAPDFVRGAVVVTSRDRSRVELGTVAESESARVVPGPQKRLRLGLAVVLEPGATKETPKPVLQKLELEIPGDALILCPGGHCEVKFGSARAEALRGGEVAFKIEGTVGVGTKSYKMTLEVGTFVRDVVADKDNANVLPPVHPVLGRLDAGR